MSRLDALMAELCPEGVEFVELGSVVNIFIGSFVKKTKQDRKFICPVYNGGIEPTGYYHEHNSEKNSVVISARGANCGFVNFVTIDFWAGNSCYVLTKLPKTIESKYLYYVLKNDKSGISQLRQVSGIPAINSEPLGKLKIPLPPVEVQREIARILDTFTELTAELTAERAARAQQYAYYRDHLLAFDKKVPLVALGEVSECFSGATPKTDIIEYWIDGQIPWMSSGEVNLGKVYSTEKKISQTGFDNCSTKMVPANTVVVALAGQGKTRGMVAITRIPLCTNQSLCSIIPNEQLNSDFLYHYLRTQYQKLRLISSGDGTRGGLNLKMIKEYLIPIPPLAEQERIVAILDRFDALTHDLNAGLPAEIAARQQQYAYYRDQLLTFQEKPA